MLISDLSSEQLLMLIVPALPNMWALKHAMYHDFPTTKEKYRWMMACVFLPCVAGVAYYFVGRKHASKEKVDIRARIEAERARAAEEKAAAEAAASAGTAAFSDEAHGEAPVISESVLAAESGRRAEGAFAGEGGVTRTEEGAAPQKRAGADEWSFGCPDDVRKPQA